MPENTCLPSVLPTLASGIHRYCWALLSREERRGGCVGEARVPLLLCGWAVLWSSGIRKMLWVAAPKTRVIWGLSEDAVMITDKQPGLFRRPRIFRHCNFFFFKEVASLHHFRKMCKEDKAALWKYKLFSQNCWEMESESQRAKVNEECESLFPSWAVESNFSWDWHLGFRDWLPSGPGGKTAGFYAGQVPILSLKGLTCPGPCLEGQAGTGKKLLRCSPQAEQSPLQPLSLLLSSASCEKRTLALGSWTCRPRSPWSLDGSLLEP